MASITVAFEESFKAILDSFPWINWSELAREEAFKKEIFDNFIKTGTLSDEDQEFCDNINWYPVDELELKEEFIKELKKARKEKPLRFKSVDEFFDTIK